MIKAKLHIPLILSMFCPGLGQLVQRRWLVGVLFLVIFLALCASLIVVVLVMMATDLAAATAMMENEADKEFSTGARGPMLGLIGSVILVYLAGVVDTYRGFTRQLRQSIRERMVGELKAEG